MPRIFIFANSFIAKTMVISINYILNKHIDEIILLSENHEQYEFDNLRQSIKIRIFDTIEQSVSACDIVLMCITPNIPQQKISDIKTIAKQFNKRLATLNIDMDKNDGDVSSYSYSCDLSKSIVILNIALYTEAQQFCGELLLSNILFKNNILTKQFFSSCTKDILEQLKASEILNTYLEQQLCTKTEHFDVAVVSVTTKSYKKIVHYLKKLRPDYVIFQTDIKGNNIDDINNILKYQFNSSIDIIIKSHYIQMENSIPFQIYCNQQIELTDSIYDLESNELPSVLEFDLLSKIALPDKIRRL